MFVRRVALAAALAASFACHAQNYPTKPVRIVVPFPAGGPTYLWFGIFAPAGTPAPILDKLNGQINRILAMSDVKSRITTLSGEINPDTPEQFRRFLETDTPKWKKIIADTGVRVN